MVDLIGAKPSENDVVNAVARYLARAGWVPQSTAFVTEHGHDLVLKRGAEVLMIEAKGAGSSKGHTSRFGLAFDSRQVGDHVAKAAARCLEVWSTGEARPGMALPDNAAHRSRVEKMMAALDRLGVVVFWVADDGTVTTSGADSSIRGS